ncbi:MAG: fluoride efflux transporter CrcB [Candidatus Omnitrophota bacterium]|jgi:CrcB protein
MIKFTLLAIGGITGTVARYLLAGAVYGAMGTNFPYGTLAVNLSGCFIVGFLAAITETKFMLSPNLRLLLMIGFCGAFTTFSTLILETSNLVKDGESLRALMNIILSVIIGFIVFRIGLFLGDIL